MEVSRQEYWSGLPFPSPGDLPEPGIEPRSPALQADALPSKLLGKPTKTYRMWLKPHSGKSVTLKNFIVKKGKKKKGKGNSLAVTEVRTWCFHCQSPGSNPGQGTKITQAMGEWGRVNLRKVGGS